MRAEPADAPPEAHATDGTDGAADDGPATSEGAGWALRAIQIAVVATYFFSVIPKILYSGSLANWGNSAILTWASIRRGIAASCHR